MKLCAALLVLAGCPFVTGGRMEDVRDGDADGERSPAYGGEDCDDTDDTVNPNAEEIWGNEVDEDCDGNIDDRDEDGVPEVVDCDDLDPTVAELDDYYVDRDEDGVPGTEPIRDVCKPDLDMVAEVGTDCDDATRSVFPGAPELCDEVDNDCDRATDEPEDLVYVTFWPDADGDGVGYGTSSVTCDELPPDSAEISGDCDDDDPNRFPGNPEICDGKDNDCDAERLADDGLPTFTYTIDLDDDGHGAEAVGVLDNDGGAGTSVPGGGEITSCVPTAPEGYADNNDDCDDTNPEVILREQWLDRDHDAFGDASELDSSSCRELPDHVGNALDCDDSDQAVNPDTVWFPDADADGFGASALPEGPSCTEPLTGGPWVTNEGDCDDTRDDVYAGAPGELPHDGVDQDCDDRTELDEDGDRLPDFAGPCTVVPRSATPATLQLVLDDLATLPSRCGVVTLTAGLYGPATVGSSVALVRQSWADVRFVSPTGGTALSTSRNAGTIELLLEKLSFEGWDRVVDLGDGSVVASQIRVDGGEVFVLRTSATTSTLTIYDSLFEGVDTVYDPSWTTTGSFGTLHLERSTVANAVAPRSVIVGGTDGTFVDDLLVDHSAAITTVIGVPAPVGPAAPRTIELRDVVIRDSLGRVLDVVGQDADTLVLDQVVLVGNISVDRELLAVRSFGAQVGPTVEVTGLVAVENTMEPTGTSVDLGDNAMFDFGGSNLAMVGSSFLANDSDASWLLTGRGSVQATAFAGVGGMGVKFGGTMDHVTLVGFGQDRGQVADGDGVARLTLSNALLADCGGQLGLLVDVSRLLVAGANPTCVLDCARIADAEFLRYGPIVPAELWDLAVLPTSVAIAPGPSCPFFGGCDHGAWTPTTAPELYTTSDDALYDSWEIQFFGSTDPTPVQDPDADGLTNLQEFTGGTLPNIADGDGDQELDGADADPWDPNVQ